MYVYVCMSVCMYVLCMYVCSYVRTHVRMHHMYIYMYIYIASPDLVADSDRAFALMAYVLSQNSVFFVSAPCLDVKSVIRSDQERINIVP